MTASANRVSTYTSASGGSEGRNGEKKDLWSSLLDSVASGKRLPEKNIIVLGGNSDSQREFLESLSNSSEKRSLDRQSSKAPPVANSFALGYTYYDVLDADQEGPKTTSDSSCGILWLTCPRHSCTNIALHALQPLRILPEAPSPAHYP